MAASIFGSVTSGGQHETSPHAAIASWFAASLAVGFPASQAVQAQVVGGNRYGIVTVHNKTQWTIKYSYRIGNGAWHQASVEPGRLRYYWHEYDFANENRSPSFHIRFDSDMGPGAAWRQFRLSATPRLGSTPSSAATTTSRHRPAIRSICSHVSGLVPEASGTCTIKVVNRSPPLQRVRDRRPPGRGRWRDSTRERDLLAPLFTHELEGS